MREIDDVKRESVRLGGCQMRESHAESVRVGMSALDYWNTGLDCACANKWEGGRGVGGRENGHLKKWNHLLWTMLLPWILKLSITQRDLAKMNHLQ